MGFGFGLGMIFIVFPLTGVLLLTWLFTRKKVFGKILLILWISVIGFVLLISTIGWLISKKELSKEEIDGDYVIDRTKFPGEQADWQYNHFRFTITKSDSIYFYITQEERIIRTYKGTVRFLEQYVQPRLVIQMDKPRYHIIEDNPTLYRTTWSFYYAFKSPKYYNVFFKKGKWTPIEK